MPFELVLKGTGGESKPVVVMAWSSVVSASSVPDPSGPFSLRWSEVVVVVGVSLQWSFFLGLQWLAALSNSMVVSLR